MLFMSESSNVQRCLPGRADGKTIVLLSVVGFLVFVGVFVYWDLKTGIKEREQVSDQTPGRQEKPFLRSVSSQSKSARKTSADRSEDEPSKETNDVGERIRQRGINHPLTLHSIRSSALEHYGITEGDADKILKAAWDVRERVIDTIHEHMEEMDDTKGAARAYIYSGSEVVREQFESELRKQLSALVNEEFAMAAVTAFDRDYGFLKGGALDIVVYVNPGEAVNSARVERVRLEVWDIDAEVRASSWEGTHEGLKEKFQLDFSEVLDQPEPSEGSTEFVE